jgi:hypothetical protein
MAYTTFSASRSPVQRARQGLLGLQARWTVSVSARDTLTVASVRLNCDLDLAQLLRVVEAWVIEESLGPIRFHLDGRSYILEAGEANWAAAVGTAA